MESLILLIELFVSFFLGWVLSHLFRVKFGVASDLFMPRQLIFISVLTWAQENVGRINEMSVNAHLKHGLRNDLKSHEFATTSEGVWPPPNFGKLPLSELSPSSFCLVNFK